MMFEVACRHYAWYLHGMNDKTPSKADALRAMREANFSAKSSGGGEKLEQPIGAGVHGKAPTTVRVPKRGEVERIAGRVASAAPETKSAKPIECPVCAARRKKKAKAQKKWRQGRAKP